MPDPLEDGLLHWHSVEPHEDPAPVALVRQVAGMHVEAGEVGGDV